MRFNKWSNLWHSQSDRQANRFDGLSLALELVVTLLKNDFSEDDLITLMDEAEGQIIDRLFDEICDRLKPKERDILTAV